jgi:hypothetical protein
MMYLGNQECVLIHIPQGFHNIAEMHHIDLQAVALAAVIDRVRAASLATHMLKSSTWNAQ